MTEYQESHEAAINPQRERAVQVVSERVTDSISSFPDDAIRRALSASHIEYESPLHRLIQLFRVLKIYLYGNDFIGAECVEDIDTLMNHMEFYLCLIKESVGYKD